MYVEEAREFQRSCAKMGIEASTGRAVSIRDLTYDTAILAHPRGDNAVQLAEFLGNEMVAHAAPSGGAQIIMFDMAYSSLSVQVDCFFAPVVSIGYTVIVEPVEERHVLVGDAVARLIWEDLNSNEQMLVYSHQLHRYVFREDGEVIDAPGTASGGPPAARVPALPEDWVAPATRTPGSARSRVHRAPKGR